MTERARAERPIVPAWIFGLLVTASTLPLVACGRAGDSYEPAAARQTVSAQLEARVSKDDTHHRTDRSLAYEHTISIELAKDLLHGRIKQVREACDSRKELVCTLLDVSVREELEVPSGHIRVRVAPTAVEPLIEMAAHGGRITARNTHAEDLAEPIADTERELSLLSSHRDRLSQFLQRKDLRVEQVISLSKEISSTQTQIDNLNTQKANLQRRVATELLSIDFYPPEGAYGAERTPVRNALRSFGQDSRDAVAQVIRFTAVLLPWLLIIAPGIVLLRLFWRWITRWLARRDLPR